MMIQLLKTYLELRHLSMYKQWTYTKKLWFFFLFFCLFLKTYFKPVILSLTNIWKHTKIQFLIAPHPVKHIDCLGKFFEAVIYRCKKQWSVVIFMTALKYLWMYTNKREWALWKTMKTRRYSLQYSSEVGI